jgi:hypothetical protein
MPRQPALARILLETYGERVRKGLFLRIVREMIITKGLKRP